MASWEIAKVGLLSNMGPGSSSIRDTKSLETNSCSPWRRMPCTHWMDTQGASKKMVLLGESQDMERPLSAIRPLHKQARAP